MTTGALIVAAYAAVLRGMFDQWWNDEDMGHGIVVPIVIAWILWRERERWGALVPKPVWWGFGVLALGVALHLASAAGAGLFAGSVAFLITVAGAVLCFGGIDYLRAWAFPLLLAIFMLPKLAVVYNQVTLPLQLLASRMAAAMLTVGGFAVIREGNILDVGGHRVLVAEACSGIRYLLPLGFMSQVIAYLTGTKAWMRVAMLTAALSLAIVANAVRVAASAYSPALEGGTPHFMLGVVLFGVCLAALLGITTVLRRLDG